MRLFNTLTKNIETIPDKMRLNLFVCGPTVYDYSHIGHARTFLFYDALVKFLRFSKIKVFYIQNITDIDDKIINRATEEKKNPRQIARTFEQEFYKDLKSLKITSVDKFPRATNFIPQIINQIERLIKKDYAYPTPGGNVYFRIKKFKEYGKLSGQNLDKLKPLEPGNDKENELDFALWKSSKPNEPKWKSPWGFGRPGWHIEDTAITEYFFGPQYDIHGGAIDLIFPHHECEIAQMESLSDKKPLAKLWIHSGHLIVNGQKMSKSLGNFIIIKEILKKYSQEVFRFAVFSHHWSKPLDWDETLIGSANESQQTIQDFYNNLLIRQQLKRVAGQSRFTDISQKHVSAFIDALNDNFNTPEAIAQIFDMIRMINPIIFTPQIKDADIKNIIKFLKTAKNLLEIVQDSPHNRIPTRIKQLITQRDRLRGLKKFREADKIRTELIKKGFEVLDTEIGTIIKKIESRK